MRELGDVIPPIYQIDSAWSAGGDGAQLDTNNVLWLINPQGTTGIFDTADNRLNHTAFNEYAGAQRSRNYLNTLPITLAGKAQGADPAGVAAARRAFAGLLADGNQHTLTVTDVDGTVLTITVEQNGKAQVTPQSQGLDFDWQLNMIAADPHKYTRSFSINTPLPSGSGGLDWSTGGGLNWATGGGLNWGIAGNSGLLTLVNSGSSEVWPQFTIGPLIDGNTLTNPAIINQNTGRMLQFIDVLGNDIVVIKQDPHNRSVTKNGAPYRRNLQIAQWFSIPAQSSITIQFQGTSANITALLNAQYPLAAFA